MSLVNEYLRKTQQEASSTLEGGVVPPVLTRHKPSNNRNLLRFALLLGVVAVAAVVVIKFYPHFMTMLTADITARQTEVAIKKGESSDVKTDKPASTSMGSTATNVKQEIQETPGQVAAQSGSSTPPAVKQEATAPQAAPSASSKTSEQSVTAANNLKSVQTLSDNSGVMTSAQEPKEDKIKIVATDMGGGQTGSGGTQTPTSDTVPPFPGDESFLEGYEGDYAPSAVVVTSKKVGQTGTRKVTQPSKGLKGDQYFQLGLSAQRSKQFSEAEGYYIRGLQRDPTNVGMMANLSAVYLEQHKYKEAEAILLKARKISPSNSKLLVNLGLLEMGRDQNGKAKHWLTEAARINPYDLDALNNLAYLAQQENDLAGMETYYQKMINLSPNNPDILLTYASLLERNNKFQEAIAVYQKALDIPGIKNSASMKGNIRKRIRILLQY